MILIPLVFLDQITKGVFTRQEPWITPVLNTGSAFSLAQGNNTLLLIVSLLIICLLLLTKNKTWGLYVILGGAIGNTIDRIFFYGVRDFINLKMWPIFNLADCFIVGGIILFLIEERKKN